ncbi:flagellar hook protein FlgE [Mobiluncus curtisii]|uniref:Flagellar hook protein FlgE n=2 Tax=Mobiluncus curtisii TaxID=2051 RepID=A0A7Y0UHC0_9ACTO|nr:flagellar hook protein FlgE [Mobiluncus curtisii]MCU9986526.1 flagellar hook protein FlgE [Mobiluncus curtisii]MCV0000241.1 flagellar hook protein FlgE [Mobiluncus curtisii]NMW48812.1 flagellar hook protein FlgE [Mobiluncus curtisii]NMW87263.1 flagellar hook protein FlgE [Mobiluncus curtisii]NMX12914.1 flagellar hook protein FlgE [Mobiluncus curtisii]
MLRSLFTGISGLSVHQTMLDVTSNNIANVNTTGFKSASTRFEDTFSQLVRSGAAPRLNERGGMNPAQVGLGVKLQSITQNFTGGAAQMTGRNLDTMINGDGFYVLRKTNGTSVYTRNGSFGVDAQGQLVAADGSFVQGWMGDKDGTINASGTPGNITLPLTKTVEGRPTTKVIYGGNIPADQIYMDPTGSKTSPDNAFQRSQIVHAYDDKGNPHDVLLTFARNDFANPGSEPMWELRAYDANVFKELDETQREKLTGDGGARIALEVDGKGSVSVGGSKVKTADTDGVLNFKFKTDGTMDADSMQAMKSVKFKLDQVNVDETTTPKSSKIVEPNVTKQPINLDLSALTGFGGVNNFGQKQVDGNMAGYMTGYSVEADGTIRGTFSNGDNRALARIAVASFANPLGLEKAGSSYFVETGNSGQPQIGEAGTGQRGAMTGGAIEMSNVDLAAEFTNLILSQRGFQANSRVITTSDEILQELVNMKR